MSAPRAGASECEQFLVETIIDTMHTVDCVPVRAIYREGVATDQATFEAEAGD